MNRILVVGIPRSGTTWVGHVLGSARNASFLSEPDNHLTYPFALYAKRRLPGGFHPALEPAAKADAYDVLWRHALGYGSVGYGASERVRRSVSLRLLGSATRQQKWGAFDATKRPALRVLAAERLAVPERPAVDSAHLVVKSIYAALSVEWIVARFPARVVVVTRGPLNVLSSWAEIGWLGRPGDDMLDTLEDGARDRLAERWDVRPPERGSSVFARAAWLLGALTCALDDTLLRHGEWVGVAHEDLCKSPHERFAALIEACGLDWSGDLDRLLDESNRPGSGYELLRVRSELHDVWRERLTREEAGEALTVLDRFPIDATGTGG